jgi:pimeloyl-ACP methyl ester carboxylesterase
MNEHSGTRSLALPPALGGRRSELRSSLVGPLSWYSDRPMGTPCCCRPLLLIHSVNAASSAFEVKPIYDHYRYRRPVYALDLPGFGFSARTQRPHTPRLMTDAIHRMVSQIREEHGGAPIDALAISLSAEFLARAAHEAPARFRSISLVSPTGFDRAELLEGPPGSTLGRPWLRSVLKGPVVRRGLYSLLTSRRTIQRYLERTWGSRQIDSRLMHYDWLTSHIAGAEYAPIDFIAGFLFSRDIGSVYRQLTTPVWVIHGNRGEFADFRGLRHLRDQPNWTIEVLATGALPHFERPGEFIRHYDDWSAQLSAEPSRPPMAPVWAAGLPRANERSGASEVLAHVGH